MPRKRKDKNRSTSNDSDAKDLWIASRYSMKGPAGERAWENRPGGVPNSSRFLELADIALGIRKPSPQKKKFGQTQSAHETQKTEPYSSK